MRSVALTILSQLWLVICNSLLCLLINNLTESSVLHCRQYGSSSGPVQIVLTFSLARGLTTTKGPPPKRLALRDREKAKMGCDWRASIHFVCVSFEDRWTGQPYTVESSFVLVTGLGGPSRLGKGSTPKKQFRWTNTGSRPLSPEQFIRFIDILWHSFKVTEG